MLSQQRSLTLTSFFRTIEKRAKDFPALRKNIQQANAIPRYKCGRSRTLITGSHSPGNLTASGIINQARQTPKKTKTHPTTPVI